MDMGPDHALLVIGSARVHALLPPLHLRQDEGAITGYAETREGDEVYRDSISSPGETGGWGSRGSAV